MRPFAISGRPIGPGHPCFLVAEVGTTANGKLEQALALADACKAAGADAIKYILSSPADFMADRDVKYTYRWAGGVKTENMFDMLQGLRFSESEWVRIVEHCRAIGLTWFLTVDYLDGLPLARQLGCPALKLSAWDIRNFPLIRAMASTGLPLLIDGGPALLGEFVTVLDFIRAEAPDLPVMILHGTHSEDPREANLHAIPYLRERLGVPVGWAAPAREDTLDALALAAGSCCIEKRLTLDLTYEGHHHFQSKTPPQLAVWVRHIRHLEAMLGPWGIRPSREDLRQKSLYFTSIVAALPIPKGARLGTHHLAAKRPGHGISPLYLDRFLGRVAARDLLADDLLTWDDVEDPA